MLVIFFYTLLNVKGDTPTLNNNCCTNKLVEINEMLNLQYTNYTNIHFIMKSFSLGLLKDDYMIILSRKIFKDMWKKSDILDILSINDATRVFCKISNKNQLNKGRGLRNSNNFLICNTDFVEHTKQINEHVKQKQLLELEQTDNINCKLLPYEFINLQSAVARFHKWYTITGTQMNNKENYQKLIYVVGKNQIKINIW